MNIKCILISLAFLCLLQSNLLATDQETIDQKIKELEKADFKLRKTITQDLIDMVTENEDLEQYFLKYKNHDDPEIRIRIKTVLSQLVKGLKPIDLKLQKDIRSVSSGNAVELVFYNKSKQPIKVYWIDTDGNRKAWRGIIKPGGTDTCERSYGGHVWLITDVKDKPLALYKLANEDANIVFRRAQH